MDLYRWNMDDMLGLHGIICADSPEKARDIAYQFLYQKGYPEKEILNGLFITWIGSLTEEIWLLDD